MTWNDLQNPELQQAVKLLMGLAQSAGYPVLITRQPTLQANIKLPSVGIVTWDITPQDLVDGDWLEADVLPDEIPEDEPSRQNKIFTWLHARAVINAKCPKCGNEWSGTPPIWTRLVQCAHCRELLWTEEDKQAQAEPAEEE